jgi:hypothetical protein
VARPAVRRPLAPSRPVVPTLRREFPRIPAPNASLTESSNVGTTDEGVQAAIGLGAAHGSVTIGALTPPAGSRVAMGVTLSVPEPAIVGGKPIVPDVWAKPDSLMEVKVGVNGIQVIPDPDPVLGNPSPGGVAATYTWTVRDFDTYSLPFNLKAWKPRGGTGPQWKSSTAFAPEVKAVVHYGSNGRYHTYTRGVHFDADQVQHMWMDWGSNLSQPFTVLVCGILHHYPYRTYGHYVLDAGKPTSSSLADGEDHQINDGLGYRSLMLYQRASAILATHDGYDAVRSGKHVISRNNLVARPKVMFGVFNGANSRIGAYDIKDKFTTKGAIDTKTHRYFVMGRRTDRISDNLGAHMTVFEIRMFTSALSLTQIRAHYGQLAATWKFNKYSL